MSMAIPALALVLGLSAAPAASPQAQTGATTRSNVNADAQVQKEFLDRVEKYLQLRDGQEKKLTKLDDSADPRAIASHQAALLRALQRARHGAQPGELFTPPTRALIRRLIAPTAAKPGSVARAAIQEENPGKIKISINGAYPTSVPLPTVPPQVLQALPRLPDEQLEFRFLGSRLILLDAKANMVIDYMDRALP